MTGLLSKRADHRVCEFRRLLQSLDFIYKTKNIQLSHPPTISTRSMRFKDDRKIFTGYRSKTDTKVILQVVVNLPCNLLQLVLIVFFRDAHNTNLLISCT